MTVKMERQEFSVLDRERTLTFHGIMLGHASSQTNKPRWTEMSIYRTDAGKYIVSGVGQSTVKQGDRVWDDRAEEWTTACEDETPRAWAHVCESAAGAVQSLYMYDDDNIRYMTNIARTALAQAMGEDEALRQAFSVEQVA